MCCAVPLRVALATSGQRLSCPDGRSAVQQVLFWLHLLHQPRAWLRGVPAERHSRWQQSLASSTTTVCYDQPHMDEKHHVARITAGNGRHGSSIRLVTLAIYLLNGQS
jgi:hypothetical protein